jgi:hypothetical protein
MCRDEQPAEGVGTKWRRVCVRPFGCYPLPRVDPAFDLAGLLDELDASVRPALRSVAFEGLDDRDEPFAMSLPL